jgi:hypothetical protein
MNFFRHLKTVIRHRRIVRKLCFKCGLIWQGLTHDLSKFSRAEFRAGVKYYQGNRSPQAKEREELGFSAAWLHHKGRNKHHAEYWTDSGGVGAMSPVKMPPRYLAEMVCDRVAASKVYKGNNYHDGCPLEYFEARKGRVVMHSETAEMLEYFLTMLKDEGEEKTFKELKKFVKENRKK